MKKIIIITGIILVLTMIMQVSAVGFSPSSLTYDLEKGEKECKMITITSDSETIKVSDIWAENKDTEWKVSLFNESADYQGISISYNNELSIDERQLEVCLSGSKVGEYHGVMLLKEEQEGNSIIQMGIWLKATITEKPEEPPSPPANSGGSSGGGGGSAIIKNTTQTANLTTNSQTTTEVNGNLTSNNQKVSDNETGENQANQNAPITGAVIGGGKMAIGIAIAFVVLLIGITISVYNKRKYKMIGEI